MRAAAQAVPPSDVPIRFTNDEDARLPPEVNTAIRRTRGLPPISLYGQKYPKVGATKREKYIREAERRKDDVLQNGDMRFVSLHHEHIDDFPFMDTHRMFVINDAKHPIEIIPARWSHDDRFYVMYVYGAWNAHGTFIVHALSQHVTSMLLHQEIQRLRHAKTVSPWASIYVTPDDGASVVNGNVLRTASALIRDAHIPDLKDYGGYDGRYAVGNAPALQ